MKNITNKLLSGLMVVGISFAVLAAPAKPKTVKAKKRTPLSVAKELAKRLNKQDMAWQFYTDYADYYYEQVTRCASFKPRTKAQIALRKQWIAYYRNIGDTIIRMRDLKRQKDDIRKQHTKVPHDQRSLVYKTATIKHRQILDDFVGSVKRAPKQRLPVSSSHKTEDNR